MSTSSEKDMEAGFVVYIPLRKRGVKGDFDF
jgi:hypothetical protein